MLNYLEAIKENDATKANNYFKQNCNYEVVLDGDVYPCESFSVALDLQKQFKLDGYQTKIILPNGEEHQETEVVELSEVDQVCLDLFGTKKPKNKSFESVIKNIISIYQTTNPGLNGAARYITYALTGRMSDKSIVSIQRLSARKLIKLIIDMKNANICINPFQELENITFINKAIAAIK